VRVQLPPHIIESEEIAYANQLVTAHLGRNTRTGLPVVVVRAVPAALSHLQQTKALMVELANLSAPPSGVPLILTADGGDGTEVLVIGSLYGESLWARLHRAGPLPEIHLLQLIKTHSALLETLHNRGISGLRPSLDMVWWDEATAKATFLGWEWVVYREEGKVGDLRAAASLWCEAGSGRPAYGNLQTDIGTERWLTLSTLTRNLIARYWHIPNTAGQLQRKVEEIIQFREMPSDKLMEKAKSILSTAPMDALYLFELVKRTDKTSFALDQAIDQATTASTAHVLSLIERGKRELELGQFGLGVREFQAALAARWSNPTVLLSASRWVRVAIILGDAVARQILKHGYSITTHLKPDLARLVNAMDINDFKRAGEVVEQIYSYLVNGETLVELSELRADIRICRLRELAREAEARRNWEVAVNQYAGIVREIDNVAYAALLQATFGESISSALQRCCYTHEEVARTIRLKTETELRLKSRDEVEAANLLRQVAIAYADDPQTYAKYVKQAEQVGRRAAIRSLHYLEAEESGLQFLPVGIEQLLHLIENSLRIDSSDAWVRTQRDRWFQFLKSFTLSRFPKDQGAAALLFRFFRNEHTLISTLESVGKAALVDWSSYVKRIAANESRVLPAQRQASIELLSAMITSMADNSWLFVLDTAEMAILLQSEVIQARGKLIGLQEQCNEWVRELQIRQQLGMPVNSVINAAKEAGVELFDQPDLSTEALASYLQKTFTSYSTHTRLLFIAIEQQMADNRDLAQEILNFLVKSKDTPSNIRKIAIASLPDSTNK